MYLPLAGFPVRHLGSNNPVPQKVQCGVRSRQCLQDHWYSGLVIDFGLTGRQTKSKNEKKVLIQHCGMRENIRPTTVQKMIKVCCHKVGFAVWSVYLIVWSGESNV